MVEYIPEAPGESWEDGRDNFLEMNGWEYAGSNCWRMKGESGDGVPARDAVEMTRRRIALRRERKADADV